jgi:hypothetical protein
MRLSPNMLELLADIATKPQMYVGTWGRWGKTAGALARKGLATVEDVDHAQSEVRITSDGRTEAIRRGILCECGRIASCKCPDTGECGNRCRCVKCRPEANCHCPDANRELGNHLHYCPVVGGAGIPDYTPVYLG